MTCACVSTVIPHSANTPGAIRRFAYYGQPSRQRLVAYSGQERMQSWGSVEAFDLTLSYYKATLRITPVTTSRKRIRDVEGWVPGTRVEA